MILQRNTLQGSRKDFEILKKMGLRWNASPKPERNSVPTIVLSTFARRDASERELSAESASTNAAVETEQPSGAAHSEIQAARHIGCRGLLRAHLRGKELEMLLLLNRLAARHGGIVWCGASWLSRQKLCSRRHAIRVIRGLTEKHWLEPLEWHGRRAYRVRAHAEWAVVTGTACDILSQGVRQNVTGGVTCPSPIRLNAKQLLRSPFGADSQEVQSHNITSYCTSGPSELLKNNITAKIAATDSTWAKYLAEEDEKSRGDLRRKFAWVCRFLEFQINENDGSLGWEFPLTVIESYKEHRDALRSGNLTRGRFACKVIDRCEREQILWPPAFTELRDRWRQIERVSEVNSSVEAA